MSALALLLVCSAPASASTIYVAAGGNLQAALDAAQPGDDILLAAGAEFVGNFLLPLKTGEGWITLRSATPDAELPAAGTRIQPAHAPLLARVRSPNAIAALRTAAGAHHWRIRYLEFGPNQNGYGDIIQLGDGSGAQRTLAAVPHHLELRHVYVHGDARFGQKRGIALNAAHVTIADSHVSECKGVGQDTQAIGGWNGPGPYVIENNYLEAAGENVLFGGADPAIPGLVADGITFRRNYLSRPLAWRQPILAAPDGVEAVGVPGGSLGPGLYAYRVVARGPAGQGAIARSSASQEVSATLVEDGSAVQLRWQAVAGATEYRVYGRTAGTQATYWRVTATEFLDTGAAGSSEAVPKTGGTTWTVKNIFELKNARNVVVEENVLEHHWKEAQPGYAIVFTPRNSNGGCTWCVVENVRVERNVVRHVAAGINLLGYDVPARPTAQSRNIVFRHNLFHDVTTALGGNGWFLLIGDEPRDVTIEHNTIDNDGTTVVYTYGGTTADPREILGFQMVANAARHGTYGMGGGFSYGNGNLDAYYPDAVFTANYLAGGPSSRYPAGNLFAGSFPEQFVDAAAGDFTVRSDSPLAGAAPDGSDIGADVRAHGTLVAEVTAGLPAFVPQQLHVPPVAAIAVTCAYLECTFADASQPGTRPVASVAWEFGDGASSADAAGVHGYAAGGTYTIVLTVADAAGLASSASATVTVEPPNVAPVPSFAAWCDDLVCTFRDTSTDADGAIASVVWSFADGSTIEGAEVLRPFAAAGAYEILVTVTDDDGAVASTSGWVDVRHVVHAAYVDRVVKRWEARNNPSVHYWSVEVQVAAHGADERPIAGAVITARWTGAVTKTASCVTGASGRCTLPSGTLSMHRTTVSLAVTSVQAPLSDEAVASMHNDTGAGTPCVLTTIKP